MWMLGEITVSLIIKSLVIVVKLWLIYFGSNLNRISQTV